MTLDEAIQHCWDEADRQRQKVPKYEHIGLSYAAAGCEECAQEHEQLAEWLTELKQRREAEISAPPKSNADKIRAMDDEDLAEWFAPHMMCNECERRLMSYGCDKGVCAIYALIYMKREVSEDAGSKTD